MTHRPPKPKPIGKYIIERRYIGKDPWLSRMCKEWQFWKRYKTLKGRETSLRQLRAKHQGEWEFRYAA